MVGFFEELAKKLAERWLTLLLVPGALFLGAVWVGVRLGHAYALSWTRLTTELAGATASLARQPGGTQAVLVGALLLGATGTGLVVQALAGLTRAIWLGQWPRPFAFVRRPLVNSRRRRWQDRLAVRRALEKAHPQATRTAEQQEEITTAGARLNRLALAKPGRPTWMGDRMHGVEQISVNRYGLDLSFGWPRLWLMLPETARTEITATHTAFAAAVATGTWAWPYLVLAILWWPGALIAAGIGLTAWTRARSAMGDLAVLSESAVDLHGRLLATELGVADKDSTGPLTVEEGEQITAIVRKGR
jgi:hypothetical protein